MSNTPIKSNLFKFVTLRSPQAIGDSNVKSKFISFPEGEEDQNIALNAIQNVASVAEKDEALSQAYSADFVPLETRFAIKKQYPDLYNFALWLGRNKLSLSYESILDNSQQDSYSGSEIVSITPRSISEGEGSLTAVAINSSDSLSDEEYELWNQLFYNIVFKKSTTIRDILIQLLIASNFLYKFDEFVAIPSEDSGTITFTDEQKENFTRLANASLIIPKELIATDIVSSSTAIKTLSKTTINYLSASLEVDKAKIRLEEYETALNEVKRAEIVYNKQEQTRYKEALVTHEAAISALKEAATPSVQIVVDAVTGFQKRTETYEELELPSFEFESNPELNLSSTEDLVLDQLSDETKSLLGVKDLELYDTFDDVKTVLQENIKAENQIIINNTQDTVKTVTIGGTTIKVDAESTIANYTYKGSLSNVLGSTLSSVGMRLKVENATGLSVTEASYTITKKNDSSVTFTGDSIRALSLITDSGYLYLSFFHDNKIELLEGDYIMEGTFTLSNGVKLAFYEDDFEVTYTNNRYEAAIIGACVIDDVDSDSEIVGKSTLLHGVTELGIADFRRVEQEVCCYVPGEVSHIENIMAREYKERTTRSLRVSESTTEQTSETEIENLTDTTTTERNEMHNEASSIVNQDNATSFGANASVSGKVFGATFSAGTNYNTSSSNSESNSNLQAQTYAQEVTERALERVVQKVSTKRTSRILQEFEENNTHGFDNRKGDEHVTGVYRWVDKIYKNTLVNYGKRLMYEFALPEPAKFFISPYLEGESSETESDLIIPVKPKHPGDLTEKIVDASSLTANNFMNVLSRYRADFIDYPEELITLNKSFKIDFSDNNNTQEGSSVNEEVEIPEGYLVDSFVINGNLFSDDDGSNHGSIILSAGNLQVEKYEFDGYFNLVSRTGVNIKDTLAISASTYDTLTSSFTVVVKCKRTSGGLLKWQNETYKAIMDAYTERVQEYNDFIVSQVTDEEVSEEKQELSSQVNRSIEKRELKRMAIDLMTQPYKLSTKGNHYKEDSSVELLDDRSGLQTHMEVIKFFEQAFDWEIMAYTFYPYFYKENWDNAFDFVEGNDPIFKAFLQSGMARSVVPVTPGFEDAVNWYMQTGEVWNGTGMVTDANDEMYVSIAEEMQTVEGEVEGTWETRVPTALTVLQAGSVALDESGLPCDPDCNEESLFTAGTSLITSEEEEEGVDYDVVGETNDVE